MVSLLKQQFYKVIIVSGLFSMQKFPTEICNKYLLCNKLCMVLHIICSSPVANVHCYTVSKSVGGDSWQLDQTNQYMMAVDKEVKRRQLAGNFNQQKMFALVKLEGAEMPASSAQASNAQKKFVIRRSDVSGKYELEVNKAPPPSDSTRQLSSWNEQAASGEWRTVTHFVTSQQLFYSWKSIHDVVGIL